MSLISDALKKAHVEAAAQNRDQHRFYMNHGGRHAASPQTSRTTVILAAAVGACITAGAALVYLSRMNGVALPVREPVTRTLASPAPAPPVVVEVPASEPKKASPVRREKQAERPAAAVAAERTVKLAAATEAKSEDVVQKPVERSAPPARTSRDNFVEGETYASPIRGPLGAELTLNGVSVSRGQAVAIVNGNLVRTGAAIGPFIIEDIEPGRVHVRYVDVRFWVSY